ncbi:MAG: ribosomal-protein-alanine N-acetyltransferase, partial [Methanoculleus bourgensis]|nr:ribosomal-protein-alanine N-acetyltransferase [Methanoculleus bourgensis]
MPIILSSGTILGGVLKVRDLVTMMPLQLTIRRAQPADIPQIVAIERIAFIDPWDERTLRESLTLYPDTFFVAQSNGDLAGFVAAGLEDTG